MKKLKISTYIIAFLTLINIINPLSAYAQEKKVLTNEEWAQTPLFQGNEQKARCKQFSIRIFVRNSLFGKSHPLHRCIPRIRTHASRKLRHRRKGHSAARYLFARNGNTLFTVGDATV